MRYFLVLEKAYTYPPMLKAGDKIPSFSLANQDGKLFTNEDFKGKWLVVYFYPKDDTPGCTKEACSFRDNFSILKKEGVEIIGISKDTVRSHKKFAQKYELPFTLLADPELGIIKGFGVWAKKKFWGREYDGILRTTFLIDPEGVIKKVYEDVNPDDHALQILNDLKTERRSP